MYIKYVPCKWNEFAKLQTLPNTEITKVNENTVNVNGVDYEFDVNSVKWDSSILRESTDDKILGAYRDENNELYLEIHRFYTDSCSEWDSGSYWKV